MFIFSEDLMQIVSKLDHTQDVESRCRVAKMLLEFLELHTGDYRLNQVSLVVGCVSSELPIQKVYLWY